MKYIDADRLKEEIERRIKSIESCPFIEAEFGAEERREGKIQGYNETLALIDSLQQETLEIVEEDKAVLNSIIRIITQFDNLAHEPTFAGPKWTHPYTKELNFLEKLCNRLFEEK